MEERVVLFVDDEVHILNSLKRGLIDEQYKRVFVTSGEEALTLMEKTEVHVIITDMRMPGMNGLKLLKIVKEKYPNVIKLVLSGYTQLPQILATVNQVDIFKFLTKPWNLEDELKQIINEAVEYYNMKHDREKLKQEIEKKNELYQTILNSTNKRFYTFNSNVVLYNKLNKIIYINMLQEIDNMDISEKTNLKDSVKESIIMSYEGMPLTEELIKAEKDKVDISRIKSFLNKYIIEKKLQNKIKVNIKDGKEVIINNIPYYLNLITGKLLNKIMVNNDYEKVDIILINNIDSIDIFFHITFHENNCKKIVQLNKFLIITNEMLNEFNGNIMYKNSERDMDIKISLGSIN